MQRPEVMILQSVRPNIYILLSLGCSEEKRRIFGPNPARLELIHSGFKLTEILNTCINSQILYRNVGHAYGNQ